MIIDLRTVPERVQAGFYPTAVSVPVPKPPLRPGELRTMNDDLRHALADVDRSTPIGVHCAKGVRSKIGTAMLRRLGFVNVTDLGGFPVDLSTTVG